MNKHWIGLSSLALITVLVSNCHSSGPDKKSTNDKGTSIAFIEGVIVKPSVVSQTILVSGTLKSFEETVLTPEVTGRIVTINLEEGKFVKKGTLLVKLFDEDLQAQLRKSQAQLRIEQQQKNRQAELLKVNGVAQSDYDQTELQVESIQADIDVAKAQIRKTEILAPFDGVVGLRNVSVGAEVGISTPLFTIRKINQLKLDFGVPEKYSKEITSNLHIQFTIQGDDRKYTAIVMATEEGIDASTRNLKVRAVVDNNKAFLNPGAFANVEIPLHKDKEALMVPTQSIIPMERYKQLIVVKNHKADFVSVSTGIRQATNIEVLQGIKAGDTVVTTGILFIRNGEIIKFAKVSKDY